MKAMIRGPSECTGPIFLRFLISIFFIQTKTDKHAKVF